MKIRTGFVSNSSSSSFVITGKGYDQGTFRELVRPLFTDEEWEKEAHKYREEEEDLYEIFVELVPEKTGLDIIYDHESGIVYLGEEPMVTDSERRSILKRIKKLDKKANISEIQMINEVLYS